jgi:hypothetical protein
MAKSKEAILSLSKKRKKKSKKIKERVGLHFVGQPGSTDTTHPPQHSYYNPTVRTATFATHLKLVAYLSIPRQVYD